MHLVVGEPLEFEPLIREYRAAGRSEQQLQAAIVARVDSAMRELRTSINDAPQSPMRSRGFDGPHDSGMGHQ